MIFQMFFIDFLNQFLTKKNPNTFRVLSYQTAPFLFAQQALQLGISDLKTENRTRGNKSIFKVRLVKGKVGLD